MRRPMVYILAFLAIGIIFGQYSSSVSIVLFVLTMVYCTGYLLYKFKMSGILLLPIIAMLSFVMSTYSIMPKYEKIEKLATEVTQVEIEGVVEDLGKNFVLINTNNISDSTVKVKIKCITKVELKIGDIVRLNTELLKLEKRSNPMDMDEFYYNRARGIDYKAFADVIEVVGHKNTLKGVLYGFREKISSVYDKSLPPYEAEILKSVVIGDRNGLTEEIKTLYQNAGIYHIIAISGLHITIIAGIFALLFKRYKYGELCIIIIMWLYCIMTGCSVSTLRATIMVSVVLFGEVIYRDSDFLNSIAFAGVFILIFSPLYIFDVGFQLSFSAVLGIALFTNALKARFGDNYWCKIFGVSLGTGIMTKPVTLYYFYYINTVDILANIIVVPLMGVVLLGGIFTGIIGLINISAARFFSGSIFAILKAYEVICTLISDFRFSMINIARANLLQMIFIYVAIASVYFLIKRVSLKGLAILVLCCSCIFVCGITLREDIAFLDVGQGDCAVISGKHNIIIDGGGNARKDFGSDTGINTLLPYLKYKGIRSVDAVFISHTDTDHIRGILEIIGKVDIKSIYIPKFDYIDDKNYNTLILLCEEYKIDVCEISSGENIMLGAWGFECLAPFAESVADKNEGSLVIKAVCNDFKILFTGDIGEYTQLSIIESGIDCSADILKVAHHGSANSSNEEFVEGISPMVAIVSAGDGNIYHHPSKSVVEMFENKKIPLLVTAEEGAVLLRTDGDKIWIKRMLGGDRFERIR